MPLPARVPDETCAVPAGDLDHSVPSGGDRLAGTGNGWRAVDVRQGTRLGVDVGTVRIGVARSDPGGLLASPLDTVRRGPGDLAELARLTAENEAIEVVVGLAIGLAGREGKSAADGRSFASALAVQLAPVPVRLVDERFTTVLAHAALQQGGIGSRDRRKAVDKAAAALLLQGALDAERSTGEPGRAAGGGRRDSMSRDGYEHWAEGPEAPDPASYDPREGRRARRAVPEDVVPWPPDSQPPGRSPRQGSHRRSGEHPGVGDANPGYGDPGYGDPGYGDAGYADSGYPGGGYADGRYGDAGYGGAGYPEPGHSNAGHRGYDQPPYPDAGYGEAGYPGPGQAAPGQANGYGQPDGYGQGGGYPDPRHSGPGYFDAGSPGAGRAASDYPGAGSAGTEAQASTARALAARTVPAVSTPQTTTAPAASAARTL